MLGRRLVLLITALLTVAALAPAVAAAAPIKATDYSQRSHWLALPSSITKRVDVFYLYPSAYTKTLPSQPNVCPVDDPGMMKAAQVAFSRQATAFAPCANIFAPYYRQADAKWSLSLPAAQHDRVEQGEPTHDAVASFDYYIKHDNHGRPFILAAHSQGSNVMVYLLAQYMHSHPAVYRRMIAAYVPGYTVTQQYLDQNHFRFASGANDTRVLISWNTEAPTTAAPDPVVLPGALAINPITWTRDETEATAAQNLGSIELDPQTGAPVLDAQGHILRVASLADAAVDTAKGALICSSVDPADYDFGFPLGVYHTFDYPFYFFDVRANAQQRIRHFFAEKGEPLNTLITEPQQQYGKIDQFIAAARKSVDMTMYSLSDQQADAALIAAAKRGVRVRVLFDSDPAGGGGRATNDAACTDLRAHGVQVRWAWPGVLWHQKSIVRDGKAAAIMTCNLYAPYYAAVRDFVAITSAPPVVRALGATFDADYAHNQRPPVRGATGGGKHLKLVWSPGAQKPLVALIASAKAGSTLYAETEQLDSPAIEQALIAAAARGVIVDVTMTESATWASGMNALAAGGVHLRVYQSGAPLYIHAKAMAVNDDTVYVGSANFTTAMTNADRNVGIITDDQAFVHGVVSTLAGDFAGAAPY